VGAEGPNLGLDPGLGLVLNPGPDPGCVLIEDLKPALFMGKPGDAPSFAANQEPSPPSPELSTVPSPISPDCTPVAAPSFAANQEPSHPSPELSTVPSPISLDCTPVALPGFAANQEPSPRSLELSTVSSPISPECMPELFLNHGSGVEADSLADVSIGVVGDIPEQGEGSRRLSQVSFPDFPLPWENALSVSSNDESDSGAPVAVDLAEEGKSLVVVSSPVKSLLKRGFFGPRATASSIAVGDILPDPACELICRGSLSVETAELDRSISHPVSPTSGISKSELGYFWRVKDKVAKQLTKNKELLAKDLDVGVEVFSKEVHRTLKMASMVGMTWGGDDKKMLDLLSARERKTKGIKELKNLDCSVSPVKSQRRRGRDGPKKAITFPPEVH
jgi:hypothetical protein